VDQGGQRKVSFTVDANVIVRWLIPGEEHETQALKLRNDYAQGLIELYAPQLLTFEVLNTLWKTVEKEIIKAKDAALICKAFVKLTPKTLSLSLEGLKNALEIAMTNHITLYDASYIATASRTNSTLITADKDLCAIARSYVKTLHLEDYR